MNRKLPVLKARDAARALEKAGFRLIRQKGSHQIFGHPDRPHVKVTVPDHGGRGLKTGTLGAILRQAEMTLDEFLELLR